MTETLEKIGAYYKRQRLSIDEILPQIAPNGKNKLRIPIGDLQVKCFSVRLRTFAQKGTKCVRCGIQATHFWLESMSPDKDFHLNLYATHEDGREILMTKDHIIPKSKGGSDGITNMRPMCEPCNLKRGNKDD